jgi:PAS domain S-box-containing protein
MGGVASIVLPKLPLFATTRHILNKAQIKAIDHSNTDGFVIINNLGRIIRVNKAMLNIFCYESHELMGQNVSFLMQDTEAKQHDQFIKAFHETGITKFIGTEHQVTACKKGGIRLIVSLSIYEVNVAKKLYFVAFIRDITDEVQMYRQIEYQRNKFHQNVRNLYQADTPELNHFKKLLQGMGEDWGQNEMLARINSRLKRRITVMVSRQSVIEHDSTMVIYIFRDMSKELKLIAHIAEKNRSQELSEAMVKMGYCRYDVMT